MTMISSPIPADVWMARAAAHQERVERWTGPARRRHASGVPHPIEDFLFTYYRFSFGKLEKWHPSFGVAIERSGELPSRFLSDPYREVNGAIAADPDMLAPKARARLFWIRELLGRTHHRPANFACHGIHEWAMVYRGAEVRHRHSTTLRLPQREIDELLESRPIACSHFDAFRFFHPDAQPLNRLQPGLDSRPEFEQPGCVHANMDLYKWAAKSMPWVGSELMADCFELALELRELDMRASPYELSAYGLEPIRIELAEGRREYEAIQRRLADRAVPLRQRLIDTLDGVLAVLRSDAPDSCHTGAG